MRRKKIRCKIQENKKVSILEREGIKTPILKSPIIQKPPRKDLVTPILKKLFVDCKNILIAQGIKYKKVYYYSGPESKRVKFFNIIKKDNTDIDFEKIIKELGRVPGVIGLEINRKTNTCSLQVYHEMAGRRKEQFKDVGETEVIEFLPIKKEEQKEIIGKGSTSKEAELNLMEMLKSKIPIPPTAIEDFYPDTVIEQVIDNDIKCKPIINNNHIEWIKEELV
jgi:hypothetical protein